ncbi:MAG: hypothetical protein RKR03_03870 [Candidatus Competibacter sp.]|nr:hypothetical protein [Candidatus Competibacter sp.]MDS4071257.1 hypothetical protein [Candidatus Competibacter sp.]
MNELLIATDILKRRKPAFVLKLDNLRYYFSTLKPDATELGRRLINKNIAAVSFAGRQVLPPYVHHCHTQFRERASIATPEHSQPHWHHR